MFVQGLANFFAQLPKRERVKCSANDLPNSAGMGQRMHYGAWGLREPHAPPRRKYQSIGHTFVQALCTPCTTPRVKGEESIRTRNGFLRKK